jgi:hypothetical protein
MEAGKSIISAEKAVPAKASRVIMTTTVFFMFISLMLNSAFWAGAKFVFTHSQRRFHRDC